MIRLNLKRLTKKERTASVKQIAWQRNKHKFNGRNRNKGRDQRQQMKNYHAILKELVKQGNCRKSKHCLASQFGNSEYCKKHYFQLLKTNSKIKETTWQELLEIYEKQNGICPITKKELIPNNNLSLDHIIPKSKGGTHQKENLRFVDLHVNTFKSNRSEQEFKEYLKQILPNLIEYTKNIGDT